MNVKYLSYFLIVYKFCNLSKAAEEIHISRQALGKIIAEVENTLGKQLFTRTTNGLIPTPTAKEIVPHVQKLLDEYSSMFNSNLMENLKERKVTVCTFDALTQVFSNDFFDQFIGSHPDIVINMEETTDKAAKEQLLLHNCDFSIVSDAVDYTAFNYTWLFYAPYGIYISKDHPLAQKESISCRDILTEKIIGKTQKLSYYMRDLDLVFRKGQSFNFILELTNNGVTRNLIKTGKYIAVAWDYTLFADLDDSIIFRSVPDMGSGGMNVYLIENPNTRLTDKQAIFKNYLIDWFEGQRADKNHQI
jgi:DNA-binding transcriptional LysR family regulator